MKIIYLLSPIVFAFLFSCQSNNKNTSDSTQIVLSNDVNNAKLDSNTYLQSFISFCAKFKTEELPFSQPSVTLNQAEVVNNMIDLEEMKLFLSSFTDEFVNSMANNYISQLEKELNTDSIEKNISEGLPPDESFFYYGKKVFENDKIVVLIVYMKNVPAPMCGSIDASVAVLCCYDKKGNKIDDVLLSESASSADGVYSVDSDTDGEIFKDLKIQTDYLSIESDNSQDDVISDSTSKQSIYQIDTDGHIIKINN